MGKKKPKPEPRKLFETGKLQDGTSYGLFHGEKPHSTRDNNYYASFADGEEPVAFDGHRIRTKVEIEESNYLKSSELSGDEIRKACTARIYFNDELVYGFGRRDALSAMLEARRVIEVLYEHPSHIWDKPLPGRKVYYHSTAALIERFIPEQGAVVMTVDGAGKFPKPVWDAENEYSDQTSVKDDLLSPHIWWFR